MHLPLAISKFADPLFGGFANDGVFKGNPERDFVKYTNDVGNTDIRLGANVFCKGDLCLQLRSTILGGGADLKTFIGFREASSDLNGLKKGDSRNIQQLQGLIRRQLIDHKRGPIGDKISKLLV